MKRSNDDSSKKKSNAIMSLYEKHEAKVLGGGAGLDHLQRLFFDAGRVSVLGGWVVVTFSFGNPAAAAAHIYLGFTLLILGVLLLTFSPAAYQFPWVSRIGAVVAKAILHHLFAPAN